VQQPPPAPKKRRKWPWIFGGAIVLLIVIAALAGGGGDSGNNEASDSGEPGTTTAAEPAGDTPAAMNTPVRDGKFEFVVTEVQPGLAEVGDNPYLNKKAQGQFVIVSMTVKNIGDEPQSFDPSSQKVFDSDGRSFQTDTAAQIALGGSDIPVWDNINPGNSVDVKVVYDMPQGAVPTSMELHDSMSSGGVKVSLTR
jgi:archaellum component FlaG (FlaF/FlaG flagellin family)